MGIRHAGLRAVIVAFLVSLGAGATAASAQTTYPGGGSATLAFTVTSPKSIVYGGKATYSISVKNNGPDLASDVKLASVTLPAAPDAFSTLKVTAVSGCTPEDTTGASLFPCDVNANMNTPTAQTVTVTVTWVSKKDADGNLVLPTACPATADTLGDVAFNFTTTTTPSSFDVLASSSGTTVAVGQFTDVGIAIDGPVNGAVGESVTYTATVTNNGPCPATKVEVALMPGNVSGPNTLLAFESGTGVCGTADAVANGCTIGDMPAGQTLTFTNVYKILPLPDSVIQTTIPIEYDVSTDTHDVNSSNDSATSGIRVGKEAGGCSSGGPGGLAAVALMAAAVFAARRRRAA